MSGKICHCNPRMKGQKKRTKSRKWQSLAYQKENAMCDM